MEPIGYPSPVICATTESNVKCTITGMSNFYSRSQPKIFRKFSNKLKHSNSLFGHCSSKVAIIMRSLLVNSKRSDSVQCNRLALKHCAKTPFRIVVSKSHPVRPHKIPMRQTCSTLSKCAWLASKAYQMQRNIYLVSYSN